MARHARVSASSVSARVHASMSACVGCAVIRSLSSAHNALAAAIAVRAKGARTRMAWLGMGRAWQTRARVYTPFRD